MIHATKRALAFIANDWRTSGGTPDLIIACTGETHDQYPPPTVGWINLYPVRVFTSRCALDIKAGRAPWVSWPDCPACLVLLDAALEGRLVAIGKAPR